MGRPRPSPGMGLPDRDEATDDYLQTLRSPAPRRSDRFQLIIDARAHSVGASSTDCIYAGDSARRILVPDHGVDLDWINTITSGTSLIHGRAGGASHARKARRWVSCPRQPLSCEIVSTADMPTAPPFARSTVINQRRLARTFPHLRNLCDGSVVTALASRAMQYVQCAFAILRGVAGH